VENKEINLLTYDDVLEKINAHENHLLIGNGFNRGLGINTSYASIFNRMIDSERSVYGDAIPLVEECKNDLESFIGRLIEDVSPNNSFLKKYIENKVKIDFMKATHEIVKDNIKDIYSKDNEGVFVLLQNFTNYFTLNYDTLLYLLLLKYKISEDDINAISFTSSIKFMNELEDYRSTNIFTEIKELRVKGFLEINNNEDEKFVHKRLDKVTKQSFISSVNEYSKSNGKNWKTKDIDRVVGLVLKEEQENKVLKNIDDGSRYHGLFDNDPVFIFDLSSRTQNLFFLHGAFHIYKNGKSIYKITQDNDKALYSKLEEILNHEEMSIVCVFKQDDKLDTIKENDYLLKCYKKLKTLSGNMVIIGSSLADNDNHIFSQIEKSNVKRLFISTFKKNYKEFYKLAEEKFPTKEIYLFDAETVSYKTSERK